jgi:hypothetical protein
MVFDNDAPDAGLDTGAEAPVTDPGVDTGGASAASDEDYSFQRWQREKGYKDPDDLGKAYGHANKQIKTVEAENAKLRQYISDSIPWIRYAEEAYAKEQGKPKDGENTPPANPVAAAKPIDAGNPVDMKKMIAEVTEEMIGSRISKLQQDVTLSNVKSILKAMREDKKTFPYMNKDIETEMNNVLKLTNKAFPISEEGIAELYNAAVGRTLPTILGAERDKITNEISDNLNTRNGSFIESDRIGEAGNLKDAHKSIVDSIKNASYGKSQI